MSRPHRRTQNIVPFRVHVHHLLLAAATAVTTLLYRQTFSDLIIQLSRCEEMDNTYSIDFIPADHTSTALGKMNHELLLQWCSARIYPSCGFAVLTILHYQGLRQKFDSGFI